MNETRYTIDKATEGSKFLRRLQSERSLPRFVKDLVFAWIAEK